MYVSSKYIDQIEMLPCYESLMLTNYKTRLKHHLLEPDQYQSSSSTFTFKNERFFHHTTE